MQQHQAILTSCFIASITALAVPTLTAQSQSAGPPQYEIQEIGSSDWGLAVANDINNRGMIAGEWDAGSSFPGPRHAVVWIDGQMIDLTPDDGVIFASATSLNDHGVVTGYYNTDGSSLSGGFRWHRSQYETLPTFAPGFQQGYGITESGLVLGHAMHEDFDIDATAWGHGLDDYDLGNLGGLSSLAYDGNGWGTIVGSSGVTLNQNNAFRWSGGVMHDIGTLPGHPIGRAYAINNHEEIVGYSGSTADGEGFYWSSEAGMVGLGELGTSFGSSAADINDEGVIVGYTYAPTGRVGAVWHDFELFDLNTLLVNGKSWSIIEARGINELGQIVGVGIHRGSIVSYLATPVDAPMTTLVGPTPGLSGMLNTIEIIEATPGAEIRVFQGLAAGESPVAGSTGAVVDIAEPRSMQLIADESGSASLSFFLPEAALGATLLFQAVDMSNGDVTNLSVRTVD